MKEENYELVFLPLFEMDLSEAVRYIASVLNSPTAAKNLWRKQNWLFLSVESNQEAGTKVSTFLFLVSGITFTQWLIGVFVRLSGSENNLINCAGMGLRTNS